MIKITNTETMGWDHAIRGMRNPMNSWDKSDSDWDLRSDKVEPEWFYRIGENDLKLMKSLAKAGSVHAKYRRMITVYADINAPLYWWKEADTYRVGVEKNSCSTMHKIHAKEFELEDFSWEHLYTPYEKEDLGSEELASYILTVLNRYRERYLKTKNKEDWWQMIQLLPSSYNQKRTVMLNYEVLAGMYKYRREHKLDEWQEFCKWIESLPYSEIITAGVENGV